MAITKLITISSFVLGSIMMNSCKQNIDETSFNKINSTRWNLSSINDSIVEEGFGVRFQKDRMFGFTTCNNIHGKCAFLYDQIVFSESAKTEMACSNANFKLENQLSNILFGTVNFELKNEELILSKNDKTYKFSTSTDSITN